MKHKKSQPRGCEVPLDSIFVPRILEVEGTTLIGVSHQTVNFSRNLSAITNFKRFIDRFDALAFEASEEAAQIKRPRNFETTARDSFKGEQIHLEEGVRLEDILEGSFLTVREFVIFRSFYFSQINPPAKEQLQSHRDLLNYISSFERLLKLEKKFWNFSLETEENSLFLAIMNLKKPLIEDKEKMRRMVEIYDAFFDFYARLRDKKVYAPKIKELAQKYSKFGVILGAKHLLYLPQLLAGQDLELNWNKIISNQDPSYQHVLGLIRTAAESL